MRRAWSVIALAVACGSPGAVKPLVKPAASALASASASALASASAVAIDPHMREHEPALGAELAVTIPQLKETKLPNGMRVLAANTGGGMFSMRLVFEGPAAFPAERPAAARLMVRSLFGGTPTHDAHALRRVLEKQFSSWSTNTAPDSISIDMTMPADDVRSCVDVIGDVVQHPIFDTQTLGFELLQIVEQGQTGREVPATVGLNVLMRSIFGEGHGYARPATILDGATSTVDRVEVVRDYDTFFDPSNATLILAGAVERSLVDHVGRAFGGWHARTHAASTPLAAVPWRVGARIVVVDRPGSVQSQIHFGALAPSRSSPDYFAMQMTHYLLGARRSSRLTHAIVERDAMSVSGATHYDARRAQGDFYWDSSVPLDKTAAALREIDKQLHDLGQTAPPAEELDLAKNVYIRQFPLWIETAHETVLTIATIPATKLPSDALDQLAPGIRAVTPDAVRKLAADTLDAAHTRVVVVGDWSKLKGDLKALGWGPIEIRDNSGKVLRTEK